MSRQTARNNSRNSFILEAYKGIRAYALFFFPLNTMMHVDFLHFSHNLVRKHIAIVHVKSLFNAKIETKVNSEKLFRVY